MEKIGIFLGNFNPPTIAHFIVANQALSIVDEVWFIPLKKECSFNKEMLEISIKETKEKKFILKNFDIEDYSDIYQLLENIVHEDNEFFILSGMDTFLKMPTWKNSLEINKKYKFIVVKRGEKEETNKKENDILIEGYTTISSDVVREKIKNGTSIKFLVPNSILKYLKKNKIFLKLVK